MRRLIYRMLGLAQPPVIPATRPAGCPGDPAPAAVGGDDDGADRGRRVASLYLAAGVAGEFPLEYCPMSEPDWMSAGVTGSGAHSPRS